jgi:hypothetical protein
MTLMTASKIANVPYERAIIETMVTLFPAIALWLPSLLR